MESAFYTITTKQKMKQNFGSLNSLPSKNKSFRPICIPCNSPANKSAKPHFLEENILILYIFNTLIIKEILLKCI